MTRRVANTVTVVCSQPACVSDVGVGWRQGETSGLQRVRGCKIHVFPAAWRARPFFLERRRAPSKRRKTVFYPNKQSLTITQMHGASRASRRVPTVPAGKRALVSRCPTAVPPCCSLFSIPRPLPVSSHNSIRSCDYCGH